MKQIDKYYKSKSIIYENDKEKRYSDVFNEYGYNLCSETRASINVETNYYSPKFDVNKDFLNVKR